MTKMAARNFEDLLQVIFIVTDCQIPFYFLFFSAQCLSSRDSSHPCATTKYKIYCSHLGNGTPWQNSACILPILSIFSSIRQSTSGVSSVTFARTYAPNSIRKTCPRMKQRVHDESRRRRQLGQTQHRQKRHQKQSPTGADSTCLLTSYIPSGTTFGRF